MEPLGVVVGLALVGVLAVAGAMASSSGRQARLEELAEDLHLTLHTDGSLRGNLAGVPIRIWSKVESDGSNHVRFTYVKAESIDHLPSGFSITREGFFGAFLNVVGLGDIQVGDRTLDAELHIQGQDADRVRAVLEPVGVRSRLLAIARSKAQVTLDQDGIEVRVVGDHVVQGRKWARDVAELMAALAHHGVGQWPSIAHEFGLVLDDDKTRLDGRVDGVRIRVGLAGHGRTVRTILSADLLEPLPAGTRIWKRQNDREPKIGDLILDSGVAMRSDDRAATRSLVCTDAARGPLMELVHGQGAEVIDGRIRLEWDGRAGAELRTAVPAVVELAHALAPLLR